MAHQGSEPTKDGNGHNDRADEKPGSSFRLRHASIRKQIVYKTEKLTKNK